MTSIDQGATLSDEETARRITDAKARLGAKLTILGHHYQRDEVIQFADHRGDSLGLSRAAAAANEAEFIVFCGVHFMAESAAVLCDPHQTVIQPAMEALCPMARMATVDAAAAAWDALIALWPDQVVPLTYQNSTAALKAFVGQRGGAVCTSSNADRLYDWAFSRGERILFMPDEHLGTNTALKRGIPFEEIAVYDPLFPPEPEELANCRVIVWKGYCGVHTRFTPGDVAEARERHPNARVIVHPECPRQVVAVSDAAGSTAGILDYVAAASAGAIIYVGTEYNLVERLNREYRDRLVLPLRRSICRTMAMTRLSHLLAALEAILAGDPINVVSVDADTTRWARVALERMLEAS